jgi:predicted transcriptional regulator
MGYAEVNEAGEFVVDDEGNRNVIENLDFGAWDHVKEMIPEEHREDKVWETIPDTATLLKNYAHSQKTISKTIRVPGENATTEEWGEIFGKLGRPDTTEGYAGSWPEELIEGVPFDPELQSAVTAAAHKAGVLPQQLEEVVKAYAGHHRGVALANEHELGQVQADLKEKWGPNFEMNSSLAYRAVSKIGGDDLHKVLDDTGLGNHPVMIDAFLRVGRLLAEDNIIPSTVEGAATNQQALDKIAEIQNDTKHPYHTGDKAAAEEMRKLFLIAYPQQG